ncbi:UDP-N-acetylmuramoyl-L-alanyl-D-glutamate--2,6-diaminopimelate ligase [Hydrogenispora ethanolica]|nr:UDP-N-acetylmuramoyl-L-alanyl-D-glutamate--2,6-diaminopimelate ligase [Hydrogenispora ethanolica]
MKLGELARIVAVPEGCREMEITGLANDSRKVRPGDLFFAVHGYKTDGLLYLDEAIRKGAVAAVTEGPVERETPIPLLAAERIREAEGLAAARFYGEPSRKLRMIGVTGTNGKTTVAHLIKHILAAAEVPTGLIGTVWIENGAMLESSERTTPDAIDLQRTLATMVANGMQAVAMEVSSHALALQRVTGTEYDAAVLTNITHDHFDFHKDYQSYLESKSILFRNLYPYGKPDKYAVLNREDPSWPMLKELCQVPVYDYGAGPEAMVRLIRTDRQERQSLLTLELCGRECRIATSLPGRFNRYNILAAVAVAWREGVPLPAIAAAVPRFPGVPGRYQEVRCGQPFRVMVDFAHNPAALESILEMAREQCSGRRIIVFGCEGEKDRLKRPLMGRIAVQNADIPILTSDNLYHEDIGQIFEDVQRGMGEEERRALIVEPDRRNAIRKALELAQPGDFVIVAGKGHEQYLVRGSVYQPFSDVQILQELLAEGASPPCPPSLPLQ